MGSYGDLHCGQNMDFEFDPSQARLVPECCETDGKGYVPSEQLYRNGVELEFNPVQSKLVPKTPQQNGTLNPTPTEQTYKNGQQFDFDAASSRLVQKKKEIDEIEQQMRHQKADKCFGFDQRKKGLTVEDVKRQDQQVKVDMNKRRTGGFF